MNASTETLKQVPQTFTRDRYDYVQVASYPGQVFIYEQRKPLSMMHHQPTGLKTTAYQVCAWEVVAAKYDQPREAKHFTIQEGWRYPTTRDWGKFGFTMMTRLAAEEKAQWLSVWVRDKSLKAR